MRSTRTSERRSLLHALSGIVAAFAVAGCAPHAPSATPVEVVVQSLQLGYSMEKLLAESTAIAVVRVTATNERINNAANRLRDPSSDRVYHYSRLEGTQVLRGTLPAEVRQVGGTVGEFTFTVSETELLTTGRTYLLFMTDWVWAFDGGDQFGVDITGGGNGTFSRGGGDTWVNDLGLSLKMQDLQRLIREVPYDPDAHPLRGRACPWFC